MATERIRVGVVGVGYWGSKHVRTLSALGCVSNVAVIDSNPARVEQIARNFPALGCYSHLDEALPHLDAVVIATPPRTHKPLALKAMSAGRHVMVEKPMATSTEDALEMLTAARSMGVTLMVGHTFEYHAAVWKLREQVSSGELGNLYYLDTARLNLGLYQEDVNVVFDLAPHDVSILNYILGAQPTTVECWASRHAHHELEDVAHLRLFYANPGVFANIHVSWLDPCKVRRVTVVGSKKMVVFDDLATEERIRVHDKSVLENPHEDNLSTPPMSYRYGDVVSPYMVMNEPLAVEDEHFVDCCLTGMRPLTGGENGLAVVQVLDAAQRSFMEGHAVTVAPLTTDGSVNGSGPVGIPVQKTPNGSFQEV